MKVVFKITQHTPIIHFQHAQPGATLRATELKPKLDSYMDRIGGFVGPNVMAKVNALPEGNGTYRVKVSSAGEPETAVPKRLSPNEKGSGLFFEAGRKIEDAGYRQILEKSHYFGNLTQMLLYNAETSLTLDSFDGRLLAKACLALPYLFALENFGSRQNKGFGSFTVSGLDGCGHQIVQGIGNDALVKFCCDADAKLKAYASATGNCVYYFDVAGGYPPALKAIFYLYNAMKAGINEGGVYSKSLLWQYLCKDKVGPGCHRVWEKRTLKTRLHPAFRGTPLPPGLLPSPQYSFVRILLGLAPDYKFLRKENPPGIRMDNEYCPTETNFALTPSHQFTVTDTTGRIKRLASPVFFKPTKNGNNNYRVYIVLKKESIAPLDGAGPFRFEEKTDGGRGVFVSTGWSTEMTPYPLAAFDLNGFMTFVQKEINAGSVRGLGGFVPGIKLTKVA